MLEVADLEVRIHKRRILDAVSLAVPEGCIVAVVGPNGAGKTTLLRTVLGMQPPAAGHITVDGRPLAGIPALQRARLLGYVPQAAPSRFPMAVFDVVLSGRRPYIGWRPSAGDLAQVEAVLRQMGLWHEALTDFDRLSGGQRQKVLLARAFVQESRYLVLDEPTSSLDLRHQLEVMDQVRRRATEAGVGTLIAVHDLNLARRWADQVVILDRGRVRAAGPPQAVMTAENITAVYGVVMTTAHGETGEVLVPLRINDG